MEISLKGKIALITGSSRGIGLEIAEAFGSAGAKVAICARQQREINAALGRLRKAKIECIGVAVDLEKAGSEKTTLKRVLKEWGAIDILVNNVGGITQTGRFEDLSDRDWLDSISLNLMPTVRFCRVAIPYLLQSTTPRIINIASMVAAQPGSYNPHYSASKAAIVNLTKHLSGIYGKQRLWLIASPRASSIPKDGTNIFLRKQRTKKFHFRGVSERKTAALLNSFP